MARIFVNPAKCTGCRICEMACSLYKGETCAPEKSMIKIVNMSKEGISAPIICRQCGAAPCERACPVGAIRRNEETGALLVNLGTCLGCGVCVEVCPFGAINLDKETGKAAKCDLCGGKPNCVEVCPTNAIQYIGASDFSYEKGASLEKSKTERSGGGKK